MNKVIGSSGPPAAKRTAELLLRGLGREIGVAILLTSVVLFISAMSVLGVYFSHMRESFAQVRRSHAVRSELSTTYIEVLQNELTLRGYALGGDKVFLVWGERERSLLRAALTRLSSLLADDPVQRQNLAKLQSALKEYQAKLADAQRVPREEMAASIVKLAKTNVRAPVAKLLMAMLKQETTHVEQQENTLLQTADSAFRIAFGIAGLALISGAFGAALTLYGRRVS